MEDHAYLDQAANLAVQAGWATWTNPRVGAVIVKDGHVLAVGYHHAFGAAHAEIAAYQTLADPVALRGATLYVTLEPCAHVGKVGACATAICEWGLARVVIGQRDPNPKVAGRGIARLQAAGVAVTVADHLASRALNPAFHYFFEQKRPYVTLKIAQSANGQIAPQSGEQYQLTDHAASVDSHRLRAQHQAIMVGSTTAMIDRPALSVRHVATAHQPWRVVLDRRGRLQHHAFANDDRTLIFTENKACQAPAYRYRDHWTWDAILVVLADAGVQALLIEGGPTLLADYQANADWQQAVVYQTALLLPATGPVSWAPRHITTLGVCQRAVLIGNSVKLVFQKEAVVSCLPEL